MFALETVVLEAFETQTSLQLRTLDTQLEGRLLQRRYPDLCLPLFLNSAVDKTPSSREIHKKLTVPELVIKLPFFNGTIKFNTVFITAQHSSPCPATNQSSPQTANLFLYNTPNVIAPLTAIFPKRSLFLLFSKCN